MVFIRTKTNRYTAKDGNTRTYTYGLLVRSYRSAQSEPPTQQVIKYLGRNYNKKDVLAHAPTYINEFDDLSKQTLAFAAKNRGKSVKEFYIQFVEDYLRRNGFKKQRGKMVFRDIVIDPKTFSVKGRHGRNASVQVGMDHVDSIFLKDVYTRLRSIRRG